MSPRTGDTDRSGPPAREPVASASRGPASSAELPEGWSYTPGPATGEERSPTRAARRKLWVAMAAALAAAAIACILVFVVFRGAIFEDDAATAPASDGSYTTVSVSTSAEGNVTGRPVSPAASPEEAVRRLFAALESGDADALFSLVDPDALEEMLGDQTQAGAKAALAQMALGYGSLDFSAIELSTHLRSEAAATVTVVSGVVAITDPQGATRTHEVAEAGRSITIEVVERAGAWYLDPLALFGAVLQIGAGAAGTD